MSLGSTNSYHFHTCPQGQSQTRTYAAARPSLIHTAHLACPLHTVAAEPGLPGGPIRTFRLHPRIAQWDIARGKRPERIDRGPPRPESRIMGLQQRIRRGSGGGIGSYEGVGWRRRAGCRAGIRRITPTARRIGRRGGRAWRSRV